MQKIFLAVTFILTLLTATAFAAENENKSTENQPAEGQATENTPFDYTSQTYGFKIICPNEPKVIVKPFENPNKKGELLVFANDGMKILFGYIIELDAFDDKKIPDFNHDKKKIIDAYIERKKSENAYAFIAVETVSKYDDKDNKGLVTVTAKELEIVDKDGEVVDSLIADEQTAVTYFRTRSGRCISIQLVAADLNDESFMDYRKSVSTYRDATDLSMPPVMPDKKSKKKRK